MTKLPLMTAEWIGAAYPPAANLTDSQRKVLAVSEDLIGELEVADEYVFAATFLVASGGLYGQGTPRAACAGCHRNPWQRLVAAPIFRHSLAQRKDNVYSGRDRHRIAIEQCRRIDPFLDSVQRRLAKQRMAGDYL